MFGIIPLRWNIEKIQPSPPYFPAVFKSQLWPISRTILKVKRLLYTDDGVFIFMQARLIRNFGYRLTSSMTTVCSQCSSVCLLTPEFAVREVGKPLLWRPWNTRSKLSHAQFWHETTFFARTEANNHYWLVTIFICPSFHGALIYNKFYELLSMIHVGNGVGPKTLQIGKKIWLIYFPYKINKVYCTVRILFSVCTRWQFLCKKSWSSIQHLDFRTPSSSIPSRMLCSSAVLRYYNGIKAV